MKRCKDCKWSILKDSGSLMCSGLKERYLSYCFKVNFDGKCKLYIRKWWKFWRPI